MAGAEKLIEILGFVFFRSFQKETDGYGRNGRLFIWCLVEYVVCLEYMYMVLKCLLDISVCDDDLMKYNIL